ncbi:hypothetical protein LDL59_04880 [Kaistella anthropi]|nr:hypothetical protein [Kaistella anthropi]
MLRSKPFSGFSFAVSVGGIGVAEFVAAPFFAVHEFNAMIPAKASTVMLIFSLMKYDLSFSLKEILNVTFS